MLENGRDALPPRADVGDRRSRLAIEANLAAVGRAQTGQDRDERRLAGAVAADETEAAAGLKRRIDAEQRLRAGKPLADTDRLDNRMVCGVIRARADVSWKVIGLPV